jgi:hypothetical protein
MVMGPENGAREDLVTLVFGYGTRVAFLFSSVSEHANLLPLFVESQGTDGRKDIDRERGRKQTLCTHGICVVLSCFFVFCWCLRTPETIPLLRWMSGSDRYGWTWTFILRARWIFSAFSGFREEEHA